jgi:FG-GAP-like repeat
LLAINYLANPASIRNLQLQQQQSSAERKDFAKDGRMRAPRLPSSRLVVAFSLSVLLCLTARAQNFNVQSYSAPVAQHIRQANLNNDAYPDLILFGDNQATALGESNPGTPLTVMINDGKGGFPNATALDTNGAVTVAIAVADFNGDGLQDIAACSSPANVNEQNELNIWINQGSGRFTLAHSINVPYGCTTVAAGDANKDGIADVVVAARDSGEGNQYNNVIITYFGDGSGGFPTNVVQQGVPADVTGNLCGTGEIAGADFDQDGNLDLIIVTECYNANNASTVWYAKGDGTGHYNGEELFASNDNLTVDEPYVADVNNDGKPDVVMVGKPASAGSSAAGGDLQFLVDDGNGSFSLSQVYHAGSPDQIFAGASGNFNGDLYQDVIVGYTDSRQPALTMLYGGSTGQYGAPVPLSTPGGFPISLATADFNNSGQTGIAALQQNASGQYTIAVYLNDTTTGGSCTAPSSAGVNICSPTAGTSPSSPVQFVAAGTGASGTVNHLELWIDGQKIGNYSGATMRTTVPLNNGSHTATIVEVDSKGAYVKSAPDTFTVSGTSGGSGAGGCEGPDSPGVNVCSPVVGSTVASPVNVIAAGTGASGEVNHLELWIDGNKMGNYPGASMNANVTLAAGSHAVTVVEVDSQMHYVKSSPVTFTVK